MLHSLCRNKKSFFVQLVAAKTHVIGGIQSISKGSSITCPSCNHRQSLEVIIQLPTLPVYCISSTAVSICLLLHQGADSTTAISNTLVDLLVFAECIRNNTTYYAGLDPSLEYYSFNCWSQVTASVNYQPLWSEKDLWLPICKKKMPEVNGESLLLSKYISNYKLVFCNSNLQNRHSIWCLSKKMTLIWSQI